MGGISSGAFGFAAGRRVAVDVALGFVRGLVNVLALADGLAVEPVPLTVLFKVFFDESDFIGCLRGDRAPKTQDSAKF
jgi:hypothetical protein